MSDDGAHMIQHLSHLPGPQPDPLLQIAAMNSLLEGFADTWLVANPPSGQTISDDEAIDLLTNLLHHGLAGS